MLLEEILRVKAAEVQAAKQRLPLPELQRRVAGRRPERAFRQALLDAPHRPALIAELKRQSPSRGMLRERFDPIRLAQELQEAGASALSVLTDATFFGGSLDILRTVHQFTEIPLLRKDFIIDAYQVYEARYYEADAVLLLVCALDELRLRELRQLAARLGLDALIEVHSAQELDVALRVAPGIIGINQRDLRTFTMHPEITAQLAPRIPKGTLLIAESGIHTADEVRQARDRGVHALLIGEALMVAPDAPAKVRELFAAAWT